MGNDPLGLVAPGYLADLLLVAGDPFAAVRILEDPANLRAIVQNGAFYKAPAAERAASMTSPVTASA
jgi:imidazolonepropionase-like amidohydrolase